MKKFKTKVDITVTDPPPEERVRFLRCGTDGLLSSSSVSLTQDAADDVIAYNCETGAVVQPSSVADNVYTYIISNQKAVEFRKLSSVSLSAVAVTPVTGRSSPRTYLDIVASEISPDVVEVGALTGTAQLYLTVGGELTTEWADWIAACQQSSNNAYFYAMDESQASAYSGTPDGYVTWNAENTDYGIAFDRTASAFGLYASRTNMAYVLLSDYINLASVDVMASGWCWSKPSEKHGAILAALFSNVPVTKVVLDGITGGTVVPDENLLTNSAILRCRIVVTGVDESMLGSVTFSNVVLIDPNTTLTAATSQENPTLPNDYAQYAGKTIASPPNGSWTLVDRTWGVLTNSRGATTYLKGLPRSSNNFNISGKAYPTGGQPGDVFRTPANGSSLTIDIFLPQESGYNPRHTTTLSTTINVNVIGAAITLSGLTDAAGTGGAFYLTGGGGTISVLGDSDHSLGVGTIDFSSQTSVAVESATIGGSPTSDIRFRCNPFYEPAASDPIVLPIAGADVALNFSVAMLKLDCDELKRIGKLATVFSNVIGGASQYGFAFTNLYLQATTPAVIAEAVGYFDSIATLLTTNAGLTIYVPDQESLTAAQTAYTALTNPPAAPTITFAVAA